MRRSKFKKHTKRCVQTRNDSIHELYQTKYQTTEIEKYKLLFTTSIKLFHHTIQFETSHT